MYSFSRNQAQIRIPIRSRFATSVRAKEQHAPQRERAVHRHEAPRQHVAMRRERARQIFQQEFHADTVSRTPFGDKWNK